MPKQPCHQVQSWLEKYHHPEPLEPPPADLCEHIATCSTCRGTLVLLTTTLAQQPISWDPKTHVEFERDLAAYIDTERAGGLVSAIRTYPHVWWHIWICTDCAEMYQLTMALVEAEAAEELAPPPTPQPSKRAKLKLLERFRLSPTSIERALFNRPQLGVQWGSDNRTSGKLKKVLIEREISEFHVTLSVRQEADNEWQLLVSLTPVTSGQIKLVINNSVFQAQLNQSGNDTVIPHIPANLLEAPLSSAILLEIEVADT